MKETGLNVFFKEYQLSKDEVANIVGVKASTITQWNRNNIDIPKKHLRTISSFFGIPEKYILKRVLTEEDKLFIKKYSLEWEIVKVNSKIKNVQEELY